MGQFSDTASHFLSTLFYDHRSFRQHFERLWSNGDENVRVFDLPEAVREQILKLRTDERPYSEPPWVQKQTRQRSGLPQPHISTSVTLRSYQEDAISAWFENQCRGLFEMATGTGKTITALASSVRLLEQENGWFLLSHVHLHIWPLNGQKTWRILVIAQ